jgi:hypothetical protein
MYSGLILRKKIFVFRPSYVVIVRDELMCASTYIAQENTDKFIVVLKFALNGIHFISH